MLSPCEVEWIVDSVIIFKDTEPSPLSYGTPSAGHGGPHAVNISPMPPPVILGPLSGPSGPAPMPLSAVSSALRRGDRDTVTAVQSAPRRDSVGPTVRRRRTGRSKPARGTAIRSCAQNETTRSQPAQAPAAPTAQQQSRAHGCRCHARA